MQELLNFDLAIEPVGNYFRARVISSPYGEASAEFRFPFNERDLEILILRVTGSIGRARRRTRREAGAWRSRKSRAGSRRSPD